MTRLMHYGLGEVVDRLTILALKLQHAVGDTAGFEIERRDLLADWRPHTADTVPEWKDLAHVNNQLWMAEDKMRGYRERTQLLTTHDLFEVADLGMHCQRLNDERAQLIASINQSQGDEHDEKRTEDSLPGRDGAVR